MTHAKPRNIYVGNRNLNPPEWTDFEWNDPLHGTQPKGEVAMIRPEDTSEISATGLWRAAYEMASCEECRYDKGDTPAHTNLPISQALGRLFSCDYQ